MSEQRKDDENQDRAVEDSFPASDPPSRTPAKGPGRSEPKREAQQRPEDQESKGHPSDDRLASETASARVQGIHPPQTDHR